MRASWSSRLEKSSGYNRNRASIESHTQCMHQLGCSSEAASGNVVKFFRVCASQSSQLEKSSQYNRKSARNKKCMHYKECSSKAASGNVVRFHVGGVTDSA